MNQIDKTTQSTQTPPAKSPSINNEKYEKYVPKQLQGLTDVGIDLGYSQVKLMALNELNTIPTAINFSIDTGIDYGENNTYAFENENLLVGNEAINESFTTLDYKFKYKYDPLLIIHSLLQLQLLDLSKVQQDHLVLRIGLALGDWKNKDEYIKRISNIQVDGKQFTFPNIKIIPQGAGVYLDSIVRLNDSMHPDSCSIVDIGYNTINFLYFLEGKPQRQYCRSYTGHGVSSIMSSFTNWLESEFSMQFSEQEAIKIFLKNKFIYNGQDQQKVKDIIIELKSNFIKKIKNSILVKEKKLLSTSEFVIFGGGGANLLEGIGLPQNVKLAPEERIYSNVRGYMLF